MQPQISLLVTFHLVSLGLDQLEVRAHLQGRAGESQWWLWLQSQHSAPGKEQSCPASQYSQWQLDHQGYSLPFQTLQSDTAKKECEGLGRKEERPISRSGTQISALCLFGIPDQFNSVSLGPSVVTATKEQLHNLSSPTGTETNVTCLDSERK